MKKKFYVPVLLTMCVTSVSLTACGSDDDEGGSSPSTSQTIEKSLGKRVTAVGYNQYSYTENGRLDKFSDGHYTYSVTYNPNTIAGVSVSYTSQGYVKSLSMDDKGQKLSATYSYDGSGHLTNVSTSVNSSGDNYECKVQLTWKNDLLTRILWTDTDYDDGKTETDTETITFHYDTDSQSYFNKYAQFAPTLFQFSGIGDGEIEGALAFVGLFGKGPKYLPVSYDKEWTEQDDGRERTGSSTSKCSYAFNSDGTLASVTDNGKRYNYVYECLSLRLSELHS